MTGIIPKEWHNSVKSQQANIPDSELKLMKAWIIPKVGDWVKHINPHVGNSYYKVTGTDGTIWWSSKYHQRMPMWTDGNFKRFFVVRNPLLRMWLNLMSLMNPEFK
jgi:hypothetical protein